MGLHKIKKCLHYISGSVAAKQHVPSMLIDWQQTATETLQGYVQRFFGPTNQIQWLTTASGKRFWLILHYFICNLHNQKLQHYVLSKNPNSVQNAITLAQKKGVELCIIEGLHSHDSDHEINNITNKNDDQNNMGPLPCSAPHVRGCN